VKISVNCDNFTVMKYFVIAFLSIVTSAFSATLNSNGSQSDVQVKWNSAADGDTVTIPAGTFTWTGALSLSRKGAKLKGAGSGRVVGRSLTSLTVGTGSKTLSTQGGLGLVSGQIVKIIHTSQGSHFMQGTVTSYSGTALTVNVTSFGGSGTCAFWVIATNPTTIVNLSGGSISVTDDASHSVEISDFKLFPTTTDGIVAGGGDGQAVSIHDMWFSIPGSHRIIKDLLGYRPERYHREPL
jgi:hypothetical protein